MSCPNLGCKSTSKSSITFNKSTDLLLSQQLYTINILDMITEATENPIIYFKRKYLNYSRQYFWYVGIFGHFYKKTISNSVACLFYLLYCIYLWWLCLLDKTRNLGRAHNNRSGQVGLTDGCDIFCKHNPASCLLFSVMSVVKLKVVL